MLPSDTSSYSTATEQKIYTTKPSIIIASGLMFKIYGKDPSQHPLKRTSYMSVLSPTDHSSAQKNHFTLHYE